jgi:hypothetical protein
MGYAAVALAVIGFAVGVVFRFRVLLPILAVLLVASLVFSLVQNLGWLETAVTIVAVQSIVQASYFLGLVVRAISTAARRALHIR